MEVIIILHLLHSIWCHHQAKEDLIHHPHNRIGNNPPNSIVLLINNNINSNHMMKQLIIILKNYQINKCNHKVVNNNNQISREYHLLIWCIRHPQCMVATLLCNNLLAWCSLNNRQVLAEILSSTVILQTIYRIHLPLLNKALVNSLKIRTVNIQESTVISSSNNLSLHLLSKKLRTIRPSLNLLLTKLIRWIKFI